MVMLRVQVKTDISMDRYFGTSIGVYMNVSIIYEQHIFFFFLYSYNITRFMHMLTIIILVVFYSVLIVSLSFFYLVLICI